MKNSQSLVAFKYEDVKKARDACYGIAPFARHFIDYEIGMPRFYTRISIKKIINPKEDNPFPSIFSNTYPVEYKINKSNLGLRIKRLRQILGLSQQELAKRAHVSRQVLSRIENGLNASNKVLVKVAHGFGISADEISFSKLADLSFKLLSKEENK